MPLPKGLAGIEVDDTAISDIDGVAGQLRYRGYPVEQLMDLPFTSVAWLILYGELPDNAQAAAFEARLFDEGRLDEGLARALLAVGARARHPMLALQSAVPLLLPESGADLQSSGIRLVARLPAALAAICAGRRGDAAPPAYPGDHAYGRRALAQITGQVPTATATRAFEQVQILQLDHGFNAGTYTARVVASTLAPPESIIAAALGALFGPLHGGADQAAIEMARRIGVPAHAAQEVAAMVERGEKVMGMGHREYRVVDPRSRIVEEIADRLAQPGAGADELKVLHAVADVCASALGGRSKPIYPNLEFYKGVVYLAVGLTPDLFTPAFALARSFGYVAHIVESRADNRIVRPSARYVGEPKRNVRE